MTRKKKKRLKKKRIFIFVILILIIGLVIYALIPKRYGYQKEVINVFKDDNVYEEIKKEKKYSKTLETAVLEDKFDKEYFTDYLNINYIDENTFIDNVNALLKLGYKSKEINTFYERIPNSISVICNGKYDRDIVNYLKLEYFDEDKLSRYIDYANKEVSSDNETDVVINNYEDIVTFVNIGLDKNYYSNDINLTGKEADKIDVIVNKYYKLPSDYEPTDLVTMSSDYATGDKKLRKAAAEQFMKMADDMAREKLKIYAGSTYRSYSYQERLYNRYVKQDGFVKAETYSARAGYSEHQLGLAIDIVNGKWEYLSENDAEYEWLINNSYKYGYILRYPKGKEYITGYMFEDWHFRYLGVDLATKVYDSKLTYDEYVARNN